MSNYDKEKELFNIVLGFVKKHNVTFVTATQPKREDVPIVKIGGLREREILVVDYINIIKLNRNK